MHIKKYIFSLFIMGAMFFLMSPTTVFADSPVTSTDFYKTYTDVSIVKIAAEKGTVDQQIADYLHSSKNPIDVKAAVVNALGWKIDGKNNAEDYVKLVYSKNIYELDIDSLSGDEIFCISYMMALDDYFHVDKALTLMDKAYEKNNTSFTIAIIRSVLKGQIALDNGNWGMVWFNTENVLNDKTLVKDMKQEAIDNILAYMKLYDGYITDKPNTKSVLNRLSGNDRYSTAAEVSKYGWSDQAKYAILASGNSFPDALSAAPLAKKYDAPILLTDKDKMPEATISELKRLQVKSVYIVGGTGVISSNIDNELSKIGISCIRLQGKDRYETSVKIAEQLGTPTELAVATGDDYSDALSIAPFAANKGMPILLVPKDNIPDSIKAYLANKNIKKTYIVGNCEIISDNVGNQFPNGYRILGSTKYARNQAVISEFSKDADWNTVFISSGENFPDALSGTAIAARSASPVILVSSDSSILVNTYMKNKTSLVSKFNVLGGESVVPSSILNSVFSLGNIIKNK
ncbi:cell wall-binding repeat-containing protein [Clostridium scatologenes]|uniref:Putative cell wall binding repeat 2-containing protein n=1 Tax=Clostridium scatologenes TaxID=1548 RepID=A0A0E3M7H6_CLOSL|nr:cell wall-binding repeat-containing protein [Clostridium scatologenes]AKA67788.1 putative cell wall binding repeat 2-containing protein [Clostridium scatologenes]